MKKEEFIRQLKDTLEIDSNIRIIEETDLRNLEEYDSLSVLSIIAMIDENFQKKLSSKDFQSITTVKSLMDIVGEGNFE